MSRKIDVTGKRLSKEDREYLLSMNRQADIRKNDELFADAAPQERATEPSSHEPTTPSGIGEGSFLQQTHDGQLIDPRAVAAGVVGGANSGNSESYAALTKSELQDILEERELSKSGNKDELIARILEDDEARATAEQTE
jgi:hypothetical protein